MSINTGLKALAGAVAIAISGGGAFAAVTTADANGTIILNLNDTTSGADYLFDTGLSVASFTGTASVTPSFNLASDPNYQAFEAALAAGDGLQYSVEGAGTATEPQITVDFTGVSTAVAQSGSNVAGAAQNIAILLGSDQNTKGGSTYIPKGSNPALGWVTGGYESGLVSNTGVSDATSVGSSLAFFEATTDKPNKTTPGTGTIATFAGTWDLGTDGVLSYTVASAVPLPTSVLLLFSGVGMMGLVARRRRSGSAETLSDGMTA